MTLLRQVEQNIRSRALLATGERLLVAVSGGVDSMVLLDLLHNLALEHDWKLSVAHFNHQLRGRSSDADARFVRQSAARLGLECFIEHGDVKRHASANNLSIEMAARELRHAFIARAARQSGIRHVALAHHADDQVELFFLRVLRGAGGDGISGMKWCNASAVDSKLKLIRPLLNVGKPELLAYARANKIAFREDATNSDTDILRNRIRHDLLPLMRRKYAPSLDRAVLRTMEILGEESALAETQTEAWLKQKKRPPFARLHAAVQRRIIRLRLRKLQIEAGFDLVESLRLSPGTVIVVRPGTSVLHDGDGKIRSEQQTIEGFNTRERVVHLRGKAGVAEFDDCRLNWRLSKQRHPFTTSGARNTEYFDAGRVGRQIILRHWRAGDRFQPIGMDQAVKLQDRFTNRKIPRTRRRKLLIATTRSGEIFWIEDERIGEHFKLTPETRERLTWSFVRND